MLLSSNSFCLNTVGNRQKPGIKIIFDYHDFRQHLIW